MDLGYHGFTDKRGTGLIHENEPTQAVFFNAAFLSHVDMLKNDIGTDFYKRVTKEKQKEEIKTLPQLSNVLFAVVNPNTLYIDIDTFFTSVFDEKSKFIYLHKNSKEKYIKASDFYKNFDIHNFTGLMRGIFAKHKNVKITTIVSKNTINALDTNTKIDSEIKDYFKGQFGTDDCKKGFKVYDKKTFFTLVMDITEKYIKEDVFEHEKTINSIDQSIFNKNFVFTEKDIDKMVMDIYDY